MKTTAAKSPSNNTATKNPIGLKIPPLLEKKNLTSFPEGNPFIQPKLRIGQPNDKYEQEADQVADQVMRMPDLKGALGKREKESSLVQRESTCPECKDEEEEKEKNQIQTKPIGDQITSLVQRQEEPEEEEEEEPGKGEEEKEEEEEPIQTKGLSNKSPQVSPGLQSKIQSMRGGGQLLPRAIRNYVEPRFGHDFSQVRLHMDSRAAETAMAMNAEAFTIGRDVVLNTGEYSLKTNAKKKLLAHELAHVVQQSGRASSLIQRGPPPSSQTPTLTQKILNGSHKLKLVFYEAGKSDSNSFSGRATDIAKAIEAVRIPKNCTGTNRSSLNLSVGVHSYKKGSSIVWWVEHAYRCLGIKVGEIHIVGHAYYSSRSPRTQSGIHYSTKTSKELSKFVVPNVKMVFHGCEALKKSHTERLRILLSHLPQGAIYGHEFGAEAGEAFDFAKLTSSGWEDIKQVAPEVLPESYIWNWAESHYKAHGLTGLEEILEKPGLEQDVKTIVLALMIKYMMPPVGEKQKEVLDPSKIPIKELEAITGEKRKKK